MDQPSRIKFEDIVQFNGSTGFSNRSNCYVSDLRSFLKSIPAGEKHDFVLTKKIDGVAVMIVAFIGEHITAKAGESVHIIEEWPWDRNNSDFTEDNNAEFYRKALRAYLLPHTVWSKRNKGGQPYYLNIALYSPTCKSLQIPHYLRKGIEDYVIAYYQSIPDKDRPSDNKIKSIILRGELFVGKAGPTAATTFLQHHRKLNTGKDSGNYPWTWSQILSLQRDMEASETVAADNNRRKKNNPKHHAETGNSVKESAVEKWYNLTGQTEKGKDEAHYAPFFGLRNFLVDAQWNSNLVIEGKDESQLEMHPQQLGLSVLDDYTGRMTESFKDTEIKQRNLNAIAEEIVWVSSDAIQAKYVSFRTRYIFLRGAELANFMNDSILQSTLVHTVPVLKYGSDVCFSCQNSVPEITFDKYCDFIATELKKYNYIENGEGFMLIQDKYKPYTKHNVTRCWKIKNFHLTPVFDEKYMTTWGFFDDIVDEGGDEGETRIRNKHVEPSKNNDEFLQFMYAVNLKHFLTVSAPVKFTREQSKAWLNPWNANSRGRKTSLTPYEPYIFTMAPWGVFKNLNSIIPSSDINTNDKLSISDIITSSQGANGHAENFLLWVQYVHTCRIRLMAPPILDGRNASIDARSNQSRFKKAFFDNEHTSTRNHMNKEKKEKRQAMLLQLFGIAKIVYMSLDKENDNKDARLFLLGQVTKQLQLTHLNASNVSRQQYSRFRIGNQFYYQLLELIAESFEIAEVRENPLIHDVSEYRREIQKYSDIGTPALPDDVRQLYGLGKKNKDDKHLRRQIERIKHLYEEESYERESDGTLAKREGLFDQAMIMKLAFAFSYKSNSLGPMRDARQEECLTKMTKILESNTISKSDTSADAVLDRKKTSLMLWHTHKIKSMPTMDFDILSDDTFMGLRGSLENNAPLSSFCRDNWRTFMQSVQLMKFIYAEISDPEFVRKLRALHGLKKEDLDLRNIPDKKAAEDERLSKFHITTLPNHWVFCSTDDEAVYTTKLSQAGQSRSKLSNEALENFALYFEQDYAENTKKTCEWVVEHLCFAGENKDLVKKIITGQIYRTAHDKDQDDDGDRAEIKRLKKKAQAQKDSATDPPPNSIFFDTTDDDLIHKDVLKLLQEKLKFDLNILQEHRESDDLETTPDNVDNCGLQEILLVAASGIQEDQFGMETEVDDDDELQQLMHSQESERTPESTNILRKTRDLVSVDLKYLDNFLPLKAGAPDAETRDTMRSQLQLFLKDQIQGEAVDDSDEDIVISGVLRHVQLVRERRVATVKAIKVGSDVGEVDFIVILYVMYRRSKYSRPELKLSDWLQTVPTIRQQVVDIAQAFRARK